MSLQKAIQGARYKSQLITWTTADDLTGATLSGTIQDTAGNVRAIDGTLTVVSAKVFAWTYGAGDVGTAGEFQVQFKAAYSQYDLSFTEYWKVEPALPAAFIFSYDLDTPVGQIRLEIGDTEPGEGNGVKPPKLANFSDTELGHFYSKEGSILGAAARACEVLARMWAGAGQNVKIRDYSINSTEKAGHYRGLAADLRSRVDGVITSVALDREDGYSADADEYQ